MSIVEFNRTMDNLEKADALLDSIQGSNDLKLLNQVDDQVYNCLRKRKRK
jgi:hypothetical protein